MEFLNKTYHQLPQFELAKRFDRSFSTKAKYQVFWLVATIIITLLLLTVFSIAVGIDETSFSDEAENFKDKETGYGFYLIEYVVALMLDPGQIDHLKGGTTHVWSLLFALLGVITITGLSISTITNMVQRRVNQYLNGEIRYDNFKGHYVIIGFGEIALAIIDQICKDEKYEKSPIPIIIMSNNDSREIRQIINTVIDRKNEKYIYVYRGRKDSGEDLDSLLIENAKEVFLIGEKEEYNRDATNMESLRKIAGSYKRLEKMKKELNKHVLSIFFKQSKIIKRLENWDNRKNNKVPITTLFDFQSTYTIFQVTDLAGEWNDRIEFRPFNFYENWAKKLLYDRTYDDIDRSTLYYPALDGSGLNQPLEVYGGGITKVYGEGITKDSKKLVHLVIFGMSNMGEALGVMAAQMCHFPNFINDKSKKTIITFISPKADKEMQLFVNRYTHFFEIEPPSFIDFASVKNDVYEKKVDKNRPEEWDNLLDIKFEFIKGKAEQAGIRDLIVKWASENNRLLSIAVCLREPEANMEIGLYLPDIVYDKEIPVFIRQKSSGALLSLLKKDAGKDQYRKYSSVYPFGMLEDCYDLAHKDLETAKLFHYYYSNEHFSLTKDNLDEEWNKLPIAHQWSNKYITYSVPFKLHSIGRKETFIKEGNLIKKKYECDELKKEEIDLLARVEQNRWMVEKLLLGYRALHKNELEELEKGHTDREWFKKRYIHPDIYPYDCLVKTSQNFNKVMSSKIPELLRHLEDNDIK